MLMCPNKYHILRQKEGKKKTKKPPTRQERDRKTDKLNDGTNSTT